MRAMFIGMDPPKHDRLKALFQRGFTPKRIAEHEDAIREITSDVLDGLDGPRDVRPRRRRRPARRLARDRQLHGHPAEDDEIWAEADELDRSASATRTSTPRASRASWSSDIPEIFERCRELIAERRENPTDDLTSVLVHAEIDGEKLEEHEIVMGFFLLSPPATTGRRRPTRAACARCSSTPTSGSCCSTTRR